MVTSMDERHCHHDVTVEWIGTAYTFLPFVRGSLEIFPILQCDVELPCKLAPGVVRVMVICRGNGEHDHENRAPAHHGGSL